MVLVRLIVVSARKSMSHPIVPNVTSTPERSRSVSHSMMDWILDASSDQVITLYHGIGSVCVTAIQLHARNFTHA